MFEGEGTFLQPIGERFALDVLHDEKVDAVFVAYVVEDADVRVVQARDRARFLLEALAQLGVLGQVLGKYFDGDGAVEAGVFRLVDFTHAARPDGREDFVRPELGSGVEWHGSAYGNGPTASKWRFIHCRSRRSFAIGRR